MQQFLQEFLVMLYHFRLEVVVLQAKSVVVDFVFFHAIKHFFQLLFQLRDLLSKPKVFAARFKEKLLESGDIRLWRVHSGGVIAL